MIRVDIETIVMASGPTPSVIVLRERSKGTTPEAPRRALSIQTGAYEAAAISRGIEGEQGARPITHDVFIDALGKLNAKLERVEITRVDAPVYFAKLIIATEQHDSDPVEVSVDARPSDALALAVRSNAPVYVEDDVMNRAGTMSYHASNNKNAADEFEQFDEFVRTLSPDDF